MGVLEDKLKFLPDKAGVYVMLDKFNQVIYVGKAKNLKNRVRQYFYLTAKTEKVMAMVKNIVDFYYIIAPSEIDALSLENNLIKKYKPRYNILLKDDKTYPYIKVDLKSTYPAFKITRKIKKDGAKYFGPYMGGIRASAILEILNLLFGVRPCDKTFSKDKQYKPCLNYHINKCSAPCAYNISSEEYLKKVKSAIEFLSGDISKAQKLLTEKMIESANKEQFEDAIKYKEYINALEKISLKRITALNKFLNADVIAYTSNGIYSAINLLVVRDGRMLGGKNFHFESASLSSVDAISEFICRYYCGSKDVPDEIIVQEEFSEYKTIENYIKTCTGKAPMILSAKMGYRKSLLDMASVNAEEHLSIAIDRIKHKNDMTTNACEKLKEVLSLKNYPKRMECYDISNISGTDKVGSMVVFINGESDKKEYRHFRIKTVEGANDFKSLQEVLDRRLEKLYLDSEKFPKPDLIIIDGGKGQLSSVKEIFDKHGITDIDLISLAEREEEIFVPNNSQPIVLSKRDHVLKMLIRIRDEAHRFAINYHRDLRGKRSLSSILDEVNGLGKVKRKALIERFKDVAGIYSASKEQLMEIDGIGSTLATQIIEKLKEKGVK